MLNFIKYILFSGLILSFQVSAKNVVVLTSLPTNQINTTKSLDKIINSKLSNFSSYKLIVKHEADQEDLYNYLNDGNTVALFWLSHGGFKKIGANSSTIKPAALLLDYNKDNVAKIFQRVHPNIQFLGVIGCNSAQILEPHLKQRSKLGSYIPTRKIIATWAMKKAIRKFKKHYKKTKYDFLIKPVLDSGYRVRIVRESVGSNKSLKVFAGKELVGLIPKSAKGEFQDYSLYIPSAENQKRKMKITFESGQSAFDTRDNFGIISISHEDRNYWKLFAKRDGTPFGTNERIYLFKPKQEHLGLLETYTLFNTN
jgi:hypothetical protein